MRFSMCCLLLSTILLNGTSLSQQASVREPLSDETLKKVLDRFAADQQNVQHYAFATHLDHTSSSERGDRHTESTAEEIYVDGTVALIKSHSLGKNYSLVELEAIMTQARKERVQAGYSDPDPNLFPRWDRIPTALFSKFQHRVAGEKQINGRSCSLIAFTPDPLPEDLMAQNIITFCIDMTELTVVEYAVKQIPVVPVKMVAHTLPNGTVLQPPDSLLFRKEHSYSVQYQRIEDRQFPLTYKSIAVLDSRTTTGQKLSGQKLVDVKTFSNFERFQVTTSITPAAP